MKLPPVEYKVTDNDGDQGESSVGEEVLEGESEVKHTRLSRSSSCIASGLMAPVGLISKWLK